MSGLRVYVLFPKGGSFTPNTIDYRGISYTIAATSIRQAYAVAHQEEWVDPERSHPVGIIDIYQRNGTSHLLWCGCRTGDFDSPPHGSGVTWIREAIASHRCE